MRPPDIGQQKGIGPYSPAETALQTANGHPVWPPTEEFEVYMPAKGTKAKRLDGTECMLEQRMSPLCYPMHDHSEPSQTSQGGNYNTGLISGIYFTGDRRGVGAKAHDDPPSNPDIYEFPMDEDFYMGFQNMRGLHAGTERCAPPIGEHMPY
jgi:hypothetical protein